MPPKRGKGKGTAKATAKPKAKSRGDADGPALAETLAETAPAAAAPVEEAEWTANEGDLSDVGEETPAHVQTRGDCALVTASCPRTYLRTKEQRDQQSKWIPEDFSKADFLKNFRATFDAQSNRAVVEAACYDEPHKRLRPSLDRRERHKHIVLKASGNFAFAKIAAAFEQRYGLAIHFSFKQNGFAGYLRYMSTPGKKPACDLDFEPATFPPNLDVKERLKAQAHPLDGGELSERKRRKRLTFAEASNLVLEGVGDGPLKTVEDLEAAARKLRALGQVELWNYLGDHKAPSDTEAFLSKVWRLSGEVVHVMFKKKAPYALESFDFGDYKVITWWLNGGYRTHSLVLSGDGGLGKTNLAEALAMQVSPSGYFFVDDQDDMRELNGYLRAGVALVVDEIELSGLTPNQVKKMLDLAKTRRIRCRHYNGTIPAGCPRIYCTNSPLADFYPTMPNKMDRHGVMRRQLFVNLKKSLIKSRSGSSAATASAADLGPWKEVLVRACEEASLTQYTAKATEICNDLGVAFAREIVEVADDVAAGCGMKGLESRRFKSVMIAKSQRGAPPQAPASHGQEPRRSVLDESDEEGRVPDVGEAPEEDDILEESDGDHPAGNASGG